MDILLLLGAVVLGGLVAGKVLQRLNVPQVVGYILMGLVLGDSVTGLLTRDLLAQFAPLSQLALGFIGFMVGGELKAEVFRRYAPKFLVILLCEGLLAACLVGAAVTALTGEVYLGLLLGALASATAPAATVNVLWEYRSKGPLTTTILAIVALDDGLGLLLYAFAVTVAEVLLGVAPAQGWTLWLEPFREIVGALALGCGAGFLVNVMVRRWISEADHLLPLLSGAILFLCGSSIELGVSYILANLAMGIVLANVLPMRRQAVFDMVKGFTPPIYILFFVFIGAELNLGLLSTLGWIGLVYLTGRTLGKMVGASLGARLSRAPDSVRKYLGWALFSQAGVAIGLAVDVSHRFAALGPPASDAGTTILNVIAATTVVVQILGPPAVKHAIRMAGEIPAAMEAGA